MTKEEAIRQIENRWSIMDYGESEALGEALDMAIESLSADVVSRDEYIKLLEESIWKSEQIGKLLEYQTEAADRPRGEWKWTHGGQCSECGFHNTNFDFNFCPNCGADMQLDK